MGKDVGQQQFSYTGEEQFNWQHLFKRFKPAHPLTEFHSIFPGETLADMLNACATMFTAVLFVILRDWEISKCLLVE